MNNMGMKMKAIGTLMLIMACTGESADRTECLNQCRPSCHEQTAGSQDACAKACTEYCATVKERPSYGGWLGFGGWIDSVHPAGLTTKGGATPNSESPPPQ